MRKHIIVCCAIAGLACSALGQGTTRVGYVDIDRVTAKAKDINGVMDEIKGQVQGIQEKIQVKLNKLKELESEAKRTEGILSKDEQDKKQKEMQRLREELQQLQSEGKRTMDRIDKTVFDPLLRKIIFAIEDVAKEQKIDIVLRGEAVIYASSSADLTDKVIEQLNASAKGAAGSKAGAPAESSQKSTTSSVSESETATTETKAGEAAVKTPAAASAAKTPASSAAKRASSPTPRAQSSGGATRPVDRQRD